MDYFRQNQKNNLTFKFIDLKKPIEDYKISFFNPTTKHARIDRNLAILLVSVWAVAVFGFQIALRVLEKPTPEQSLVDFELVWDDVREGKANLEQNQLFCYSCLSVIGKQSVKPDHMSILKNAFGTITFDLVPDDQKMSLQTDLDQLTKYIESEVTVTEPAYVKLKNEIAERVAPVIAIDQSKIQYELIHLGLTGDNQSLNAKTKSNLHQVMKLYLTHNQSVLTDIKFLGFPFHYFYTAVFLLIIFVGICWFYCVRVDKLNVKLGLEEK